MSFKGLIHRNEAEPIDSGPSGHPGYSFRWDQGTQACYSSGFPEELLSELDAELRDVEDSPSPESINAFTAGLASTFINAGLLSG